MKKTLLSLATILVISTNTSLFAAAVCPSAADIHSLGSTFNTAYQSPPNGWVFTTEGFAFNKQFWQTHFNENLSGVTDPYQAIEIAEKDFATLNMLSNPVVTMNGEVTICDYTPAEVSYMVYVENTVI